MSSVEQELAGDLFCEGPSACRASRWIGAKCNLLRELHSNNTGGEIRAPQIITNPRVSTGGKDYIYAHCLLQRKRLPKKSTGIQ